MTNEEKANLYGHLLNEHTKISNKISEIKGQSIDLSQTDLKKIKDYQNLQLRIMRDINRLLS